MKRMHRILVISIALLVVALVTAGAVLAAPPRQGPVVPQKPVSNGGSQGGVNQPGQPSAPSTLPGTFSLPPGVKLPEGAYVPTAPQQGGQPNQSAPAGAVPQSIPAGQMSYQGKLLQSGTPYNGNIAITFSLYTTETSGTAWYSETQTVNVQNGLFNVMLGAVNPIPAREFYDQQWLGIQPAGAASELTPRQLLGATAYAAGVWPGATMVDSSPSGLYGSSFYVDSYNHNGLYGSSEITGGLGVQGYAYGSAGIGVYGGGDYYGVYGAGGYGTYGHSSALFGVGAYGENTTGGWGVLGNGIVGVAGIASGANGVGVIGSGSLTGTVGVAGSSGGVNGYGVTGSASGGGSCGGSDTRCSSGVYGEASGDSYGSWFHSTGRSTIAAIPSAVGFFGVYIHTTVGPTDGGLSVDGDSSFAGYVTFSGGKSGYVLDIARNSGSEPLERGDVVVITGYSDPVVGQVPVIEVAKATSANTTGVVGVVDILYRICDKPAESLQPGERCGGWDHNVTTIQPGEYLGVVTLGSYGWIKVDASSGPIQAGDLLATSATTGYAAKAPLLTVNGVSFAAPGTIVGKALGSLDSGMGMIPVFVSAR